MDTINSAATMVLIGTVRLTANIRGKETTENLTVHVVDVNGEWRWILSQDTVDECA